ncbi:MAG: DUF2955 domain-containing protein [Pseudomonadales bacterium]
MLPTQQNNTRLATVNLASRRTLRLALGTALSLWCSQAAPWTLSYLAPVITLFVLALPQSAPGIGGGIKLFLALVLSVWGGLALLPLLLLTPTAGAIALSLLLFGVFYATARGAPAALSSLVTIGLALTVAVGSVSVDLVLLVAEGVSISAAVGVIFVWIAFALIPDTTPGDPPTEEPAPPSSSAAPLRSALRSLAIVLPVTLWLLVSSASAGYVGVMIKVASMGQQASMDETRGVARSLILATLTGGLAATLAWQLLQIWPALLPYTLIIGLAGLLFGARIFHGRGLAQDGATWSYAYLTMLIILAPAVLDGLGGSPAGAKFFDRLWMFAGATAYAIIAVGIFDAFWPARRGSRDWGRSKLPE